MLLKFKSSVILDIWIS